MVLDPDPNNPYDMPGSDGCLLCGMLGGLALTLLIAFGLYKSIKYFELTLPEKIVSPHK